MPHRTAFETVFSVTITMSSYLEKQTAAFGASVSSVAPKISNKRTLAAPPASAPSPAPSNASNSSKKDGKDASDLKRKREPTNVVYSQPAATGYGTEAFTQVHFVIEYLKNKNEAKTFREILEYLSQMHAADSFKKLLNQILKKHGSVHYTPDSNSKAWDSGTFKHRPKINVRTKEDLLGFLQIKPDARGVELRTLKDGWPDCDDALTELEAEHKILVTRNKKDNVARRIWGDDPSLHSQIDPEFHALWKQVELPSVDDTVRKLLEAGQKPASEDPSKRVKAPLKPKEKKKKAPRKGGRTTNSHMAHLLKDFSHVKR